MILLVNICSEPFHYFEFVKPIEEICKKCEIPFRTLPYKKLDQNMLNKADKVIICGTSLKDNGFFKDQNMFSWIPEFSKPLLGICGGMHILGLVFDGTLQKTQEIGLQSIDFKSDCFGLSGSVEVYELHNFFVKPKGFSIIASSKQCPQVIQYPIKPFIGVFFHPEVRNKTFLEKFIKKKVNSPDNSDFSSV